MTVDTEVITHTPSTTIVTVTQPRNTTVVVTETETVEIQETVLGVQGEAGLSAYEVAVRDGFVGTEDEWLASLVGPTGPQGPSGATGPQGAQGQPGLPGTQGDLGGVFQYEQVQSSTVWQVDHNLGYYPNVTTVDSAGTRIEGDVSYPDITTVTVTFSVAIGGRAYLS